ncbi:MAG: hypothetical protein PHD25_07095 [Bacteroidales bacterium]|nr:hypothetical protein [Bacteroidales bacterium]
MPPILKKILPYVAGFLLAVILLVAIHRIFFRSAPSRGSEEILRMVPADAVCIIESSKPADMLKGIRQTSMWKDFMKIREIRSSETLFMRTDTMLTLYRNLKKTMSEYPAVAGIHMAADSTPCVLLILEVPSRIQRTAWHRFLDDMAEGREKASARHLGKKIHIIKNTSGTGGFYYTYLKNYLLASNDSALLCQIMEQTGSGNQTPADDPSFIKVMATTGKKVNTHLFLNHSRMKMALPTLFGKGLHGLTDSPYFPDGWSAFDVTVKNNECILSGFTALSDPSGPFNMLFHATDPSDISIQRILPFNTVFSIQACTGDFRNFFGKIRSIRGMGDTLFTTTVRSLRDPTVSIDLEKRIESMAGPEICLAFTGSVISSHEQNTYIILRSSQMETSLVSLDLLSDPDKNATMQLGQHIIRRLIIPNPFVCLFYDSLKHHNRMEWFTTLDDYIVFGETKASVHRFLSYYLSGRTMTGDPSRSAYLDYFPERSNLSFNINARFAGDDLLEFLDDSVRSFVLLHKDLLSRFEGLGVHFMAMNDMFYTTVHLNYNPSFVGESPYVWKVRLDGPIIKGPLLIDNPVTGKGNVVVFDQTDQMVLIDENGVIRWKRKLSSNVLSDVFRVDQGHDHQPRLLFNTTDSIYLLDLEGRLASGYPLAVPAGAGNGLTVLDYANDRTYRIILATKDRKILNLDISGNPVKGWNNPPIGADLTSPVQHVVAAGKDYLIFSQKDGKVLMTDRKGNVRLRPDKSFHHSDHADFYPDADRLHGIMYSTDVNGNVVFVTGTGATKKVSVGDYLPDHFFLSEDFNMDKKADFIFLDKNRISVHSQNRKLIAEVPFPEVISHPPAVFVLPARSTYLGFYSGESGTIYLLSKEGFADWVKDIKSDRPFQIGYLDNRVSLHLIAGYRDEVFNYLFE